MEVPEGQDAEIPPEKEKPIVRGQSRRLSKSQTEAIINKDEETIPRAQSKKLRKSIGKDSPKSPFSKPSQPELKDDLGVDPKHEMISKAKKTSKSVGASPAKDVDKQPPIKEETKVAKKLGSGLVEAGTGAGLHSKFPMATAKEKLSSQSTPLQSKLTKDPDTSLRRFNESPVVGPTQKSVVNDTREISQSRDTQLEHGMSESTTPKQPSAAEKTDRSSEIHVKRSIDPTNLVPEVDPSKQENTLPPKRKSKAPDETSGVTVPQGLLHKAGSEIKKMSKAAVDSDSAPSDGESDTHTSFSLKENRSTVSKKLSRKRQVSEEVREKHERMKTLLVSAEILPDEKEPEEEEIEEEPPPQPGKSHFKFLKNRCGKLVNPKTWVPPWEGYNMLETSKSWQVTDEWAPTKQFIRYQEDLMVWRHEHPLAQHIGWDRGCWPKFYKRPMVSSSWDC